jgi:hypothetical protein
MNLETFEQTVVPTLNPIRYRMTTKGFFRLARVQSVYKTEFPFNNEYERYFVIEDSVYTLSDTAKMDVNESFKLEDNYNGITFEKTEKSCYVNVPKDRFILVNEQVTDNLIVVEKDRSIQTIQESVNEFQLEKDRSTELIEEAPIEMKQNTIKTNTLETTKDFYEFVTDVLDNCENTLINKGREYTESHWLENFEDACRFKGLEINSANLIKILDGYRLKHQVSIMKLQKDIENGKYVSTDLINEKYGDLINYNLIEQAIILKYNNINKFSF